MNTETSKNVRSTKGGQLEIYQKRLAATHRLGIIQNLRLSVCCSPFIFLTAPTRFIFLQSSGLPWTNNCKENSVWCELQRSRHHRYHKYNGTNAISYVMFVWVVIVTVKHSLESPSIHLVCKSEGSEGWVVRYHLHGRTFTIAKSDSPVSWNLRTLNVWSVVG